MIISVTILSLGKWITPHVTGRQLPPCYDFTLLSLSGSRILLHGGINPLTSYSDIVYIATITGYELVSVIIISIIILLMKLIIMVALTLRGLSLFFF